MIGGGEIYNLALPYADQLDITRVHNNFEADTFSLKLIQRNGNYCIQKNILKMKDIFMITVLKAIQKSRKAKYV